MNEELLTLTINDWKQSEFYLNMVKSKKYYETKNDILNRKFFYYSIAQKLEDNYRANIKIACDFYSTVVDQKISYCFAKDVVIENFPTLSLDINEEIDTVAEEAALSGCGWAHIYIDSMGMLKLKTIDSLQIIPIHDSTIEENLVGIIRHYQLKDSYYAEYWDSMYKTTYILDGNGIYTKTDKETHLNNNISWGSIPFISFKNNRHMKNDLVNIKTLIDAYDIIISDFCNNFVDFQELILFIKNYQENVATETAAAELMDWIKKYKVISVKGDGSLDIISKEIPYQARAEILNIIQKNIFKFAKAVDMDELKGGSLTNVVIQAYFANLDLKADKFIKEGKKYIMQILNFSNLYNSMLGNKIDALISAKIICNKTILVNQVDIVDMNVKSDGIISKKTNISNHPWVTDIEEELKQIDEDMLAEKEEVITNELKRVEEVI